MNRPALPAPVNGDFDIPMPDDSTEVCELTGGAADAVIEAATSDLAPLESSPKVVSMDEQLRIAMDNAWLHYNKSGQRERDEIHRALLQELNAGLHNLHEPFEGLVR